MVDYINNAFNNAFCSLICCCQTSNNEGGGGATAAEHLQLEPRQLSLELNNSGSNGCQDLNQFSPIVTPSPVKKIRDER